MIVFPPGGGAWLRPGTCRLFPHCCQHCRLCTDEEGGPYADTLIVQLPKDPDKRKKLFEVYNDEIKKEGYHQVAEDEREKSIVFWWD